MEVVYTDKFFVPHDQTISEMGSEKARAANHQDRPSPPSPLLA